MHILHIVSSLGTGGAEAFATDLARTLAVRGHRVTVVVFSEAAHMQDTTAKEAENRAALEAAGVGIILIGHLRRRQVLPAIWQLRRILSRLKPDLVHAHLKLGILAVCLAFWRGRLVVTHHNTPLHKPVWLMRLLARRASAYIGISAGAVENLRGICRCPVTYIPTGIDFARLGHGAAPRRAEGSALTSISAGMLRPQKNYPLLIDVVARAREAGIDLSARIAGGGETAALARRIAERGLEGHVELLGSRSDVAGLMRQADFYLLTSLWEGKPIALMEAMASGLPVIASDVGGCGEVLGRDGACAILCDPARPESFVAAIRELAENPDRRAAMAVAARERVREFSIESVAERHIDLYARLLDRAAP